MSQTRNPLDLNGTAFDPDQYLRRVLKVGECGYCFLVQGIAFWRLEEWRSTFVCNPSTASESINQAIAQCQCWVPYSFDESINQSIEQATLNSFGVEYFSFCCSVYRKKHYRTWSKRKSSCNNKSSHWDSDMQTLVYENYNKFITATDTIRKAGELCLCAFPSVLEFMCFLYFCFYLGVADEAWFRTDGAGDGEVGG